MATQDQDQKLCDRCHERPATCHICHGNSAHEGESLCRECFELSNPTVTSGITKVWEAGCQYCGGPPVIGGADPLATIGGIHKLRCMCKPCSEEYHRFLQLKMPGFGTVTMTKE
jgi:hypothetical protein